MPSGHKLILASASNRRHALLDQLNISYKIRKPDIDETPKYSENPKDYVQRMAVEKVQAISRAISSDAPILGADTIVCQDAVILDKPQNKIDAIHHLECLSGREHQVFTALYLQDLNQAHSAIVETIVKFRHISQEELIEYCSTGEPFDKAGAYAIQGLGVSFVDYFIGSYTGVVGLPAKELIVLLQQANINN